jgi:hypothetical protein
MSDRITTGDQEVTVAMECSRGETREPKPFLERGDQRLVIERLAGRGQHLEQGEDAQELLVT